MKRELRPGTRVLIHREIMITKRPQSDRLCVHPVHGLVYILDGAEVIHGRLSNHFSWRKVNDMGFLWGPIYLGYGGEFE